MHSTIQNNILHGLLFLNLALDHFLERIVFRSFFGEDSFKWLKNLGAFFAIFKISFLHHKSYTILKSLN